MRYHNSCHFLDIVCSSATVHVDECTLLLTSHDLHNREMCPNDSRLTDSRLANSLDDYALLFLKIYEVWGACEYTVH